MKAYKYYLFFLLVISSGSTIFVSAQPVYYSKAYTELTNMLCGESYLSFKEAVFIVENAYSDNIS